MEKGLLVGRLQNSAFPKISQPDLLRWSETGGALLACKTPRDWAQPAHENP